MNDLRASCDWIEFHVHHSHSIFTKRESEERNEGTFHLQVGVNATIRTLGGSRMSTQQRCLCTTAVLIALGPTLSAQAALAPQAQLACRYQQGTWTTPRCRVQHALGSNRGRDEAVHGRRGSASGALCSKAHNPIRSGEPKCQSPLGLLEATIREQRARERCGCVGV